MTSPAPDLGKLFDPASIAVIGASNNLEKLPGQTLWTLLRHGVDGPVFPVNRTAREVQGLKAYPRIEDLPVVPDLAVLVIPAAAVPDALESCGALGVGAAIIITSGFAEEQGAAGRALQARLERTIRQHGMAVLGPNAQGFANLARHLCPTFSPTVRLAAGPLLPDWAAQGGRISVVAQSGALGFALFDSGRRRELPFRFVVTTGNEAGLSAFDVVDYLLDEGGTEVVVLFLEAIRDGAVFRRVAEKALRQGKPMVVAKVGLSEAAERSAASHTGALAGSFRAHRAMFDAYGVTLAESHEELIDLAAAFMQNRHRLPKGRRVGICTSSGGAGGWTADACVLAGLEVPELEPAARARIDRFLPPYGSSANPVDGTAQAIHLVGHGELTRLTASSERVDGVIGIASAMNAAALRNEGARFAEVGRGLDKSVVFWSYTHPAAETFAQFAAAGYPLCTNLRHAARAMAALAAYREAKDRFAPPLVAVARPAEGPDETMTERDSKTWLARSGVLPAPGALATGPAEAAAIAARLGGRLALKIQSPDIPHKSEAGGVALNVTAGTAAAAFAEVLERVASRAPGARIDGVLVEPMAPAGGFEMILGTVTDPVFGPMLLVGAGGIFAEILDDTAISPLVADNAAALRLIDSLRCAPMLRGARGLPPRDRDALATMMLGLCRFAAENAEAVVEIDLNPVLVHERGMGVTAVDALIVRRLLPAHAAPPHPEARPGDSPEGRQARAEAGG